MRGQFFILGAVLICALFFIGLPLYGPQVQPYRKDLSFSSDNLESEFPKALNLGLKTGKGPQRLADFSNFSKSSLAGQNMRLKALWVESEPQGSSLLVTVGNFMGESQTVRVTIGAETRDILVQDSSTENAQFSPSESFQASISFPGHSRTGTWIRNKASLYAFLELSRGADVATKEIEG